MFAAMKKLIAVILFIISISTGATSQVVVHQYDFNLNTLFIEAGGNAVLYSLNYDRIILNNKLFKISCRGGVEYLPSFIFGSVKSEFAFPVEVNFLFGKDEKFIECGAGVALGYEIFNYLTDQPWGLAITGRIGYRLQKQNGFFFRAGFVPIMYKSIVDNGDNSLEVKYHVYPWVGVGVGKTF